MGIQVADAVTGSFGQILKETLSGKVKEIDIGIPRTGYEAGTVASLGWCLRLRQAVEHTFGRIWLGCIH